MVKTVLLRGLYNFPIGVFIGYTISIIGAIIFHGGNYWPVSPSLVEQWGSQIAAVVFQYVLMGLLGFVSGVASVIWEIDAWSLLKQTVVHFCLYSVSILTVASLAHWMTFSLASFAAFYGILVIIYVSIWIAHYVAEKRRITQINKKLQSDRSAAASPE